VARAVNELVAVAGRRNDVARRPIHFEAVNRRTGGHRILHTRDGRVAPRHDDPERVGDGRRRLAGKPAPRDVRVHRSRLIELAPQIKQQQLELGSRQTPVYQFLIKSSLSSSVGLWLLRVAGCQFAEALQQR